MKKKLGKFVILCLEGAAVSVALLTGLVVFAHWQISHGGLSLSLLKPVIVSALEDRLAEGGTVRVGQLVLLREAGAGSDVPGGRGETGAIKLFASNLAVSDPEGKRLLQFPEMVFEMRIRDMAQGHFVPRFVEIADASVSVTRKLDGTYDFGFTQQAVGQRRTGGDSNLIARLLGQRGGGQYGKDNNLGTDFLDGVVLRNMQFEFIDKKSGEKWLARGAQARLVRLEGGYEASLNAPFSMGGKMTDLRLQANLNDQEQQVRVTLLTEQAPVASLMGLVAGAKFSTLLETTLSGQVEAVLDYQGTLLHAQVDMIADAGRLILADKTQKFEKIILKADYQPVTRRFDIAQLEYDLGMSNGVLKGIVSLGPVLEGGALAPQLIEFDLEAGDVVVDVPDFFEQALSFKTAKAVGQLDLPNQRLSLTNLQLDFFGRQVRGQAEIQVPAKGGSPSVQATATIGGVLSPREILRGWPQTVAVGVRNWIARSVPEASVSEVNFTMDLPAGAIQPGQGLKNDYMHLTFAIADATAIYVPGMTPLIGVEGQGLIMGNSFILKAKGGRIGSVRVVSGEVDMPTFFPRQGPGFYRAHIEGEISEILSIIDQKPLQFIEKGGFSPDGFSGQGTFDFDIMRPMRVDVPLKEYDFNGTGSFSNTNIANVTQGYDLSEGIGDVSLSEDEMVVQGRAVLEGVPLNFIWTRSFSEDARTQVTASGVVDALAADNFGISLRQFLRGNVGFEVDLLQEQGNYQNALVQLDLREAELNFEILDWTKPRGEDGGMEISLRFPQKDGKNGLWHIDRIDLETDTLVLAADAYFVRDGGLVQATLERFFIEGRADLNAKLAKADGALNVDVSGAYASIDLLAGAMKTRDGSTNKTEQGTLASGLPLPGNMQVQVNLDRFDMRQGVALYDFKASLDYDGEQIKNTSLSGLLNNGGKVDLVMSEDSAPEISRQIFATTDNLGALAKGFFGIETVEGGMARYIASELQDGPFVGTLTASNFRLTETPLIARIFASGSLGGLNDLLSGEGIEIEDVTADLQLEEGVLSIVAARATGPSIGLSVGGEVDFVLDSFDISGAFAPAYQVNSILGRIPGIGDLLVSRRGEGLVAFSYQVAGPVAGPTVSVNALSLLTPGIFRRIFEPARAAKKSTADLLQDAMEAAELASQRELMGTAESLQFMEKALDQNDLPVEAN